jgi:dTDP-4-dehydrorhamnose reductase
LYINKLDIIKITFCELIRTKPISDGDIVVNFSFDNLFYKNKYTVNQDRDLKLVRLLKNKKILFIILSSRMVYKQRLNLKETSFKRPINTYGRNKLIIENHCSKIRNMKPKILILRLSNIIGYEINRIRTTLMSEIINGIKKKNIQLDDLWDKKKDLMPVALFCKVLFILIKKRASGIFNIGSGVSISLLELSKILLRGKNFKNVKITIKKKLVNNSDDSYSYNISKLKNVYKFNYGKKNLINDLKKISKKIYENK